MLIAKCRRRSMAICPLWRSWWMPQRGWLTMAHSARRERDLRSYSFAAASCRWWRVEPSPGAITGTATRQGHGSQGRNTTRGIAPAAFLLRRATARSRALASQPRCGIAEQSGRLARHSETPAGVTRGGSARLERRDGAVGKTVLERSPSASAPIRLRGPLGLVAEPMLYRRSRHPSRRRIVRSAAEGPFFHGANWSAEPPLVTPARSGRCRANR